MARYPNDLSIQAHKRIVLMISVLTGSSTSKIKSRWSTTVPYVTGYDIFAEAVYSVSYGKVVYVGQELDGTYTVNIKCNDNEILRYGHLKGTEVLGGVYVTPGILLGKAFNYVHFEYLTRWSESNTFPVRVLQYLYFKQDPSDIVEGIYLPVSETAIQYDPSRNRTQVDYVDSDQQYEFRGN